MPDKVKFLEMLRLITETAKGQGSVITKEEIKAYFGDVQLEEAEYQHVYRYLAENRIEVEKFQYRPAVTGEGAGNETKEADSQYLKMYQKDLNQIPVLHKEERISCFKRLKEGDKAAAECYMKSCLKKVVSIAKTLQNRGMCLEDLIQEGNVGLICAMESIKKMDDLFQADHYIDEVIREKMKRALDGQLMDSGWLDTVVAKANLIHEAANYLAEDLGRTPAISELAEYTRMDGEEIKDILELSLNEI